MIQTSAAWRQAIDGDVRRTRVRVPARITDPDLQYGTVTANSEASFSRKDQTIDGEFSGAGHYATGETNRWILSGPQDFLRKTTGVSEYDLDWSDLSTTSYPTGWTRGYYRENNGDYYNSNNFIRTAGAPVSRSYWTQANATRLVCAAPAGYAIAAYEYDTDGTFLRRHGDPDTRNATATNALDISFPAGHKFRFAVGYEAGMGNPESENYRLADDTFVSTITAKFVVPNYDGQMGYVSGSISGSDGAFSTAPALSVALSGVEALRAVTVQFPEGEADGYGVDFTVSASASGTVLDSVSVVDNGARRVLVSMSAANPDTVTVTISKWSLPGRRARIVELYPGYAVDWNEGNLTAVDVKLQCSLSTMQQPYGTASLTIDNTGNLFDPLDKSSMFQAVEEGQGFPVELGLDTDSGTEYMPLGVFYHHNRGWSQRDSNMTMQWSLVDIIGLLSDVNFTAPETMPATLEGWMEAIVGCLGSRFEGHCAFDPEYLADYQITAAAEDVDGKGCAELLRMLCQASGCVAQTRREDGYLLLRSELETGPDMTLDNLSEYPVFSANDYMGTLTFTLPDGEGGTEDFEIIGTDNTVKTSGKISSPFITTESAATEIAERIFSAYGGNKIALRGRGEPSAELGDIVWVQTKTGQDASGRILSQNFKYTGGVLEGCQTELLHTETRYNTYGHRVVFTEDGEWTVPEGVTEVHAVLIGGGDGGGAGYWWPSELWQPFWNKTALEQYGTQYEDGSYQYHITVWYAFVYNVHSSGGGDTDRNRIPDGETGKGGKVLSREVSVNPGETMNIVIGQGGAGGRARPNGVVPKPFEAVTSATPGTPTTFGAYSSENGERYAGAYTDIFAGGTYAKDGQPTVLANSGNGGKSGTGANWVREFVTNQIYYDSTYGQYVSKVVYPYQWYAPDVSNTAAGRNAQFNATDGVDGSSGICVIYYNDPPEEEEA